MTYILLRSAEKKYHKKVIHTGFVVLENYRRELLQYAGERPYLPLTKEEIFSDLIIDRMPRFIENCQDLTLEDILSAAEEDLSAAGSHSKFLENQSKILRSNSPQKEKLLNHLKKKQRLLGVEKKLLAYLRSCVRRTKIKYLQQFVGSSEGKTTFNCDPCNGLQDFPDTPTPDLDSDIEEVRNVLRLAGIDQHDIDVIDLALLKELSYSEMSKVFNRSRTSVARDYKSSMAAIIKKRDIISCLLGHSEMEAETNGEG